jgi:hypothetical protein
MTSPILTTAARLDFDNRHPFEAANSEYLSALAVCDSDASMHVCLFWSLVGHTLLSMKLDRVLANQIGDIQFELFGGRYA